MDQAELDLQKAQENLNEAGLKPISAMEQLFYGYIVPRTAESLLRHLTTVMEQKLTEEKEDVSRTS